MILQRYFISDENFQMIEGILKILHPFKDLKKYLLLIQVCNETLHWEQQKSLAIRYPADQL